MVTPIKLYIPWDNESLARSLSNPRMADWIRNHGVNISTEGINKFGDEADEDNDIIEINGSDKELKSKKYLSMLDWLAKHKKQSRTNEKAKQYLKMLDWLKTHKKQNDTKAKQYLKMLEWLKTHKKQNETKAKQYMNMLEWLATHKKHQNSSNLAAWLHEHKKSLKSSESSTSTPRHSSSDIAKVKMLDWLRQHKLESTLTTRQPEIEAITRAKTCEWTFKNSHLR